jgi:DNA-binding CsgD family transcriptional regulator
MTSTGHFACIYTTHSQLTKEKVIMSKEARTQLETDVAIDSEAIFLLQRLLELAGNQSHLPFTAFPMQPFDGFEAANTTQSEVVLQLEVAGTCYQLIKSHPLTTTRTTLSPREREIVWLVSSGYANKGIAHKLAISQHTVNTHVRRIFGKLGVNSRAEMVAYALQSGLVAQSAHLN